MYMLSIVWIITIFFFYHFKYEQSLAQIHLNLTYEATYSTCVLNAFLIFQLNFHFFSKINQLCEPVKARSM